MRTVSVDDLRCYLDLRIAIRSLRDEVEEIEQGTYRPYDLIAGRKSSGNRSDPTAKKAMKLIEVRERLATRIAEYEEMTDAIEEWSLTIKDPVLASAIRWHYLHGESWQTVGSRLYGYPTAGDGCRVAVRRYLERMSATDAGSVSG